MTWQSRAACRDDFDPELWFALYPLDIQYAKEICAGCPVRIDCLDRAMADEDGSVARDRHGVWGGLTGPERATLAGKSSSAVASVTVLSPDEAAVYRRAHGERSLRLTTPERLAVVRRLWAECLTDREIEARTGINRRVVLRDRQIQNLPAVTREARSA